MAATTCRPAFSINTSDAMPMSWMVRRSASRICSALRILILGIIRLKADTTTRSGGVRLQPDALGVGLHRRTDAHQIAITIWIIDAADAWPELVGAHPGQRE